MARSINFFPLGKFMKAPRVFTLALLATLVTGSAYAQCADPPTSPRGRCIKQNGGRCDPVRKIWVSPNDQVRLLCAPALARRSEPSQRLRVGLDDRGRQRPHPIVRIGYVHKEHPDDYQGQG